MRLSSLFAALTTCLVIGCAERADDGTAAAAPPASAASAIDVEGPAASPAPRERTEATRPAVTVAADGPGGHDPILHPGTSRAVECVCTRAKLVNGWCAVCSIGYVAGLPVESEMLFETIDAHGHTIDLGEITCQRCRAAMETDEFCDRCGVGWLEHRMYFSRLTHLIAGGVVLDVAAIECERCREHAVHDGWCETCGIGMIGHVALSNREAFEQAASSLAVLDAAIAHTSECELCACAMAIDGYCPRCRIRYRAGEPTDETEQR